MCNLSDFKGVKNKYCTSINFKPEIEVRDVFERGWLCSALQVIPLTRDDDDDDQGGALSQNFVRFEDLTAPGPPASPGGQPGASLGTWAPNRAQGPRTEHLGPEPST